MGAKFRESAETPPLRVKGVTHLGGFDPANASMRPRLAVLFNAGVQAGAAAGFFHFEDAAHQRVEAQVEQAADAKSTRLFARSESDDNSLGSWTAELQPEEAANDFDENGEPLVPDAEKPAPPRGNLLLVRPAKPLPPGKAWHLVIDAGLPAAEWPAKLPAPKRIEVGEVQPFAISAVAAEGNRVAGRRLRIDFTKTLADDVTRENLARWVQVEPTVPKLKLTRDDSSVTASGDFALGATYRVTVAAGMPAAEPAELASAFTREFSFQPYEARLYFPEFDGHQRAGGSRLLRLVSVNVPRVRVTARLFRGPQIAAALKAFDDYNKPPEDASDEYYSRVDAEALPGELIWQQEFTPGGAVDTQQVVELKWDEIGAGRTGTILFTAESVDPVTATGKRVGTQTLMQLTDIGAAWKRDRGGYTLHLFSLATGQALAKATVALLDAEAAPVAQSTSDAQGQAHLPPTEKPRWFSVSAGDDTHVIPVYSGEIPLYRLGVYDQGINDFEEGRFLQTIFLFTERGVYKPGDKLHLKGYAQDLRSGQQRIPAGKPVTVTINDAKDRQIHSSTVTLSDFGSFELEFTVPAGTLGKFQVAAVGEKETRLGGSCSFQVQEYKPNAFEVVIPKPPDSLGSTALALPVTSKYYMGQPLSQARLSWSLVARDETFAPEGLGDFAFGNAIADYRFNRALDKLAQFNAQGEVAIDAHGVALVQTPLPVNAKAPQPRAARLFVEVTDQNQQTVSEARQFTQHASEFYLGVRRFDAVLTEGAPLPLEVIALRPDGQTLDQPAKANVRVSRIRWQTNRLATAGDTSEFESTPQLEKLWEHELLTAPGRGEDRKPKTAALADALAGPPGEYLLEVSAQDAGGRPVLTSLVFEVSGEAETDWNYRNPYVIDLVSDKDTYAPGETANLLVKTPIAGDALVTVERDQVLRSFVVRLTGNAPSVQVPILATDAPNVFVSVLLLRGAEESPRKMKVPEYRIGYASLKVARPDDQLTVTVQAACAERTA